MQKNQFDPIWDQIYQNEQIEVDPFLGSSRFPLGTKYPPDRYDYGRLPIPEEDIVYTPDGFFVMAYDDASSIVMIGLAGTGKTKLAKLIMDRADGAGFRTAVFDSKGAVDWPLVSKLPTRHLFKHPEELPRTIDIVGGSPSFALTKLSPSEQKKLKILDYPMSRFADRDLLNTLGFSIGAQEIMIERINRGESPKEIADYVRNNKRIDRQSAKNILKRIYNLIDEKFFSEKSTFSLDEVWDNKRMFAMGCGGRVKRSISTYGHLLLEDIRNRADRLQISGKKEHCYVLVDDAHLICGRRMDPDKFISYQTAIDSLALLRSRGINMIFATQTPKMLADDIYENAKFFFISKTGSLAPLKEYIFNWEIFDKLEKIDYRPEQYISEWVCIQPGGRWFSFYPFDPKIRH